MTKKDIPHLLDELLARSEYENGRFLIGFILALTPTQKQTILEQAIAEEFAPCWQAGTSEDIIAKYVKSLAKG